MVQPQPAILLGAVGVELVGIVCNLSGWVGLGWVVGSNDNNGHLNLDQPIYYLGVGHVVGVDLVIL